ncbi:MAG: hypothetical protein R2705_02390 [Ilumatobacteraceae bacterium]
MVEVAIAIGALTILALLALFIAFVRSVVRRCGDLHERMDDIAQGEGDSPPGSTIAAATRSVTRRERSTSSPAASNG